MSAVSQTGEVKGPCSVPAGLQKLIPALLILAALPGCVHLMVEIMRWRSGDHISPFGDGANVWAAARLVLSGRLSIVLDPYFPQLIVQGVGWRPWAYPPPMLMLAVPFGLVPLPLAMLVYDALSVALLAASLRSAGFSWAFAAAILTSPAALDSVIDCQNGALLAGLLVCGLWQAERTSWLGGVVLGLATIKPQLGLLIPVYLVGRGNWRAILAAAATAGILAAASALAFGPESWARFMTRALPYMSSALVYLSTNPWPGPQAMLMSVFSLAREAGSSVWLADGAQGLAAAAAIFGAFGAARWVADRDMRLAMLLLLSPLASPYLWSYDMIPLSLGVALLVRGGLRRGFLHGEFWLLALLWITPGIAIYQAAWRLPSFCPPVLAGAVIYAWLHGRAGDAA